MIAGFYKTTKKARERMARAVRRGRVKLIGYVENAGGRDVKLLARFPVNKPQHDYEVTALLLVSGGKQVRRGPLVDERNADAEIEIDGIWHYLEHDRGTMGYAEVIQRMNKYIDCTNPILWVFSSQTRIDGVLERTHELPANFLFTTFSQACHNFHSDIWMNAKRVKGTLDTLLKSQPDVQPNERTPTRERG